MQVMPQILNFVEIPEEGEGAVGASGGSHNGKRGKGGKKAGRAAGYDTFQLQMDMDWGTIAAFVCATRCDLLTDNTGSGFCEEFAWRQVFPCVCLRVCECGYYVMYIYTYKHAYICIHTHTHAHVIH
jgi:hypothetical protein